MQDRKSILDKIIKDIKKNHQQDSIMTLEERLSQTVSDVVSTGSLAVDLALGGGIPRGRIIEIYGPESSGKTTLALNIIREFQKSGGFAAFIDVEHAFDPEYAKRIGVKPEALFVSQPTSGDVALNIASQLSNSGAVEVIVIDSVAALVPQSELDGEVGDSFMGVQARLIAQAIRKLVPVLHKNNCTVIFINQIREKIGVVFGSNEVTPGGRALKFAATIRAEIRRMGNIKHQDQDVGIRSKVRIVKNKVAVPFKIGECEIIFGKGISEEASIIDVGVDKGVLTKKGSWISFKDSNLAQGKDNLRNLLISNKTLKGEILKSINDVLLGKKEVAVVKELAK